MITIMVIIFDSIYISLNMMADKIKELDFRLIVYHYMKKCQLASYAARLKDSGQSAATCLWLAFFLSPWITQVRWCDTWMGPKRLFRGESHKIELAWQSTNWQATQQQLKARPTAPPRGGTKRVSHRHKPPHLPSDNKVLLNLSLTNYSSLLHCN